MVECSNLKEFFDDICCGETLTIGGESWVVNKIYPEMKCLEVENSLGIKDYVS